MGNFDTKHDSTKGKQSYLFGGLDMGGIDMHGQFQILQKGQFIPELDERSAKSTKGSITSISSSSERNDA